ncbi:MAG: DUF1015 domain-containing protein [Ignavibacteria bacterium]|jgi:uncharacterized protein (DUF1015 family)|nr:DUF1015 domain-containing protein [Ignavibacteria bacterium]MCU7504789.1 DUF1015 domain-containing protein [Ignavibacteria bacterium]MCU7518342.1 DUF1015 domain-containing protein [Ignavibacteria bacterium]
MAVIRPFKALRPKENVAHLVASVPYDVVNRDEAAVMAQDFPFSYLRITRAEIELDKNINPYSEEVYLKAKENLLKIKSQAPLITDEKSHLYIYKLVMGSQEQVGIAATFSVDDYDNNVILKHEKTRKDKEDDRTKHIVTTEAQTGPVFLTYRGVDAVNEAVDKTMQEISPVYDFTAPDGIKHTIWIMPDEYTGLVIKEIASVKNLYIADGHHRAASAARAQKVKKENNPGHNGSEEYNFFLAVLFPAEQLRIMPYNRAVADLNGLSEEEFFNKIKEHFTLEESGCPEPPERRSFAMFIEGKWYLLKPNSTLKPSESFGENLDVSVLQNYLLNPILGIDDPRTNKRIDFIGGIRGTGELEKLVNSGRAAVAFSMYPVSVDDLMNISDAGEIMPPKSTWFEPKLRDGLLVHLI